MDIPLPIKAAGVGIAADFVGDYVKTKKFPTSPTHIIIYGAAAGTLGFYINRWILNSLLGLGLSDMVLFGITGGIGIAQRQFINESGKF